MTRFMLASCLAVAAAMVAAAGVAAPAQSGAPSSASSSTHYGWAEVLRVDPVYAALAARLRQCPPAASATAGGAGAPGGAATSTCKPVDQYAPQQHIIGYDVEYRYRGEVYMARMAYDPGERMRVQITVTPDG